MTTDTKPVVSKSPVTGDHLRRLRRAGIIAVAVPIPLTAVSVLIGRRVFFPDTNLGASVYLDYLVPHRTGEWQVITWPLAAAGYAAVLIMLAATYIQRAGRLTVSGLSIICGALVWVGMELMGSAVWMVNPLMSHGYPSYGTGAAANLVTFTWNLAQITYALGVLPLAAALIAVAVSDHADPIVPPATGGWAFPVIVAVLALAVTGRAVFIDNGRWTLGSPYAFFVGFGPAFGWIAVLGTGLLLTRRSPHP
jgi:hypothetical protein